MITKTVDWLGIQIVVEYEVVGDCVAYTSITPVDPATVPAMLERLLAAIPCPEHTFHVVPALAHLGEVLEPTDPCDIEDLPPVTHAAPSSMN